MAAVIPKNLQLVANRLANMERTVIRVRPQSNDSVSAGQTIHFRLPTNTLIDLHNLQLYGMASIEGTTPHGLPSNMQQAIERLDVVVNGQSVYGNNNDYGGCHALLENHVTKFGTKERGEYMNSGDNKGMFGTPTGGGAHISMRQHLKNSTGIGLNYGSSADGGSDNLPSRFPFVINGLKGLLSGKFVRFIDTAVLGPVEIRLRLAPGHILWRGTETYDFHEMSERADEYQSTSAPDYTFSEMYMYLDTISFADDFYRLLLANRLAQGGIITIPFENMHSFQKSISSNNDTITFNLATQSLNMLMGTFRNSQYNTRNSKRYSEHAKNTNFYKFVSADDTDYTRGPYTSKSRYQWQVNNKLVPTWPVTVDEAYVLTRGAFDLVSDDKNTGHIQYPQQYRDGQFVFAQAFDHHGDGEKIISGIDTRGASSNMAFAAENLNVGTGNGNAYSSVQCTIWALTTATLEISAGQNVTLIL